ncbi:MAG TPA: helical backbone metal receptor [Bacteroidia bacterium]|nr:helical backbone metal receptor [Bacteroidia bacterium]
MGFSGVGHNCDKCINLIDEICAYNMTITDQLNRTIEFTFPPKKIVSLVPSQSELLWYLGLQKELVGITKFCLHPTEMFQSVKRIGGTKTVKFDEIQKLKPDLIIANKEENQQEQIEELCKHFPVYISDIYTVEDALQMIEQVGLITDRKNKSEELANTIKEKYNFFKSKKSAVKIKKRVAYLIWKNPYMAAGSSTFITNMLHECCFINVFGNHKNRYPEINIEDLKNEKPDFIFLSSEPYPFKEKHIQELQLHLPNSKIILVDGEMFSWYGSRLLYAFDYFEELIKGL